MLVIWKYSYVPTVQLIKDGILFMIVVAIVLVDTTILLVGTAISQSRLNATLISFKTIGEGNE